MGYRLKKNAFLSLKIDLVLANSAGPDEMRMVRISSGSTLMAKVPDKKFPVYKCTSFFRAEIKLMA